MLSGIKQGNFSLLNFIFPIFYTPAYLFMQPYFRASREFLENLAISSLIRHYSLSAYFFFVLVSQKLQNKYKNSKEEDRIMETKKVQLNLYIPEELRDMLQTWSRLVRK